QQKNKFSEEKEMKRLSTLLSVLVLASMVLAACGGGATPTAAPATEMPATEAPATEMPATEAPATEAPATEAPAVIGSGTIKIATQSPLSGGQSLLGVAIKQGAELGLEQLGGDLKAMGFD